MERIEDLLRDLFVYVARGGYSLTDIKLYCFGLSDKVKLILAEYFDQINPYSVSTSMQGLINGMFSLQELECYYLQFFSNVAGMLKERSAYAVDGAVNQIQVYIRRNYQKKLTVEFVSSLFYLNRSYCSHLFKKEAGVNLIRISH